MGEEKGGDGESHFWPAPTSSSSSPSSPLLAFKCAAVAPAMGNLQSDHSPVACLRWRHRWGVADSLSLTMPQAVKAMLPLKSRSQEAQMNEALSASAVLNSQASGRGKLFTKASKLAAGANLVRFEAADLQKQVLCLSGSHPVGENTRVEATVQGSQVHLRELSCRIIRSLGYTPNFHNNDARLTGKLVFTLGTDFQRHRFTAESMMGLKEETHTLSTIITSNFFSTNAFGLASSHKLGKHWTIYSRYSRDGHAGRRLILQAVQRLGERNTISSIFSSNTGGSMQMGISWAHALLNGDPDEAFQLKALYGGKGLYTLAFKLQLGKFEDQV